AYQVPDRFDLAEMGSCREKSASARLPAVSTHLPPGSIPGQGSIPGRTDANSALQRHLGRDRLEHGAWPRSWHLCCVGDRTCSCRVSWSPTATFDRASTCCTASWRIAT